MARERCACGRGINKNAAMCFRCRQAAADPCACGQPKHYRAERCDACARLALRGPTRTCEGCAREFWRKNHGTPSDAFRFCSRDCWFTFRKRLAAAHAEEQAAVRAAIAQAYEMRRAWAPQPPRCACGKRISADKRQCCLCAGKTRRRSVVRTEWPLHICPNCGAAFWGMVRAVFCSVRCSHQYISKRTKLNEPRYPRLSAIALGDRNPIAELVSLVRAANRVIDADNKNLELPQVATFVDVEPGGAGAP